jgi:hypothetical protein
VLASTTPIHHGLTPDATNPSAAQVLAQNNSRPIPMRDAIGPLSALPMSAPMVQPTSSQPRLPSERPNSARIDGQATPSAPSGRPTAMKPASPRAATTVPGRGERARGRLATEVTGVQSGEIRSCCDQGPG